MVIRKKLPIGIEFFREFKDENFYYIDKTGFISELLHDRGKVNLFTRPRRFGKSLNMDMLKSFFEIGCDPTLFDGLKISQDQELCGRYMGKYPVIAITLKSLDGLSYQAAVNSLKYVIGYEADRFPFLAESEKLTDEDKKMYRSLTAIKDGITDDDAAESLRMLCRLLSKHYEKNVIVLIDEYDVPLDKAFQQGYYDEMVALIRNFLGNILKTNPYLEFAVLTGCLRISKESIFTGLNNLKAFSITDVRFAEYFGFTDDEVKELLEYYGLSDHYESVKTWYDGYRFGDVSLYCPWDVLNHCDCIRADPYAPPEDYWSNTSGNSIVKRFIDKAGRQTRDEIERLIEGETITKDIRLDLTYNELDTSIDNLWSVLFMTGYLTQRGREGSKRFQLAIPNEEIRELFIYQIREWFRETTRKDAAKLDTFCEAFPAGDAATIGQRFNDYLWNTISVRDTAVPKERKENFYHGMVLGLLHYKENWLVQSNAESGEGYSDILIEVPESRTGVVVEMKYAEGDKLEAACTEALAQIDEKQYDSRLRSDGMQKIIKVAIACCRKHCMVQCKS
jgi:hypothetical protein